jgi:hypothetical protein
MGDILISETATSSVFLTNGNECLTSLGIRNMSILLQATTKMHTKVFMIPFKQNALKLAEVMSYGCTG